MSRVQILGIPIDNVTEEEVVAYAHKSVRGQACAHVMTPNNEMLVLASRDKIFFNLLQVSDLNIPDSTGIVLASKILRTPLKARTTGADTMQKICSVLTDQYPVFLLGAGPGVAQKAAEILQQKNPLLVVAGTHSGSPSVEDAPEIIKKITDSGAKILFVAFGAPAQDAWIAAYKDAIPNLRFAMGIGGTFDFIAGTVSRAPKWMRSIGLEWMWRLLLQPTRIGRICKAVIVFPCLVLVYGKKSPWKS